MSKHTPGPWQMKQSTKAGDQQEDCIIYARDKGIAIHIAETFQYQNGSLNSANGTSIANAHLIASAPELLEACKESLKIIDDPNNEKKMWIKDVETLLEQAITKAEGEKR